MREAWQHRRENGVRRVRSWFIGRSRHAAAGDNLLSTDQVRMSLEGDTGDSDDMRMDDSMAASLDEYVSRRGYKDIQMLILSSLARYSTGVHNIIPTLEDLMYVPRSVDRRLTDIRLCLHGRAVRHDDRGDSCLYNTNIDTTLTRCLDSIQYQVYM
ncbi:hypothetical protein AVEN_116659-1 [Araneus ventricosus]|uniref:Uncharacterized protein n=1 Tax=Araneus ventricosus TaxID=182803 RepID=A0A4Y2TZ55_ARAVE|nr:hypothetical protein AVEN_116659-1 [Araneus ventricosus]